MFLSLSSKTAKVPPPPRRLGVWRNAGPGSGRRLSFKQEQKRRITLPPQLKFQSPRIRVIATSEVSLLWEETPATDTNMQINPSGIPAPYSQTDPIHIFPATHAVFNRSVQHLVQRFLLTITDVLAFNTRRLLMKYTMEYAETKCLLMISILYLPPLWQNTHEFVVLLMSHQMEVLQSGLRRTSLGRLPFMYRHVRSTWTENTAQQGNMWGWKW
jgi:hypothetical protein